MNTMFSNYEQPRNPMGYSETDLVQKFSDFEMGVLPEWTSLGDAAFFVSTMLSRAAGSDLSIDFGVAGRLRDAVRGVCENFTGGVRGLRRFVVVDADSIFEFFEIDLSNGEIWQKRKDESKRQRCGFAKRLRFRCMRRIRAHGFGILFDLVVGSLHDANPLPDGVLVANIDGVFQSRRHYMQKSVAKYAISRSLRRFDRLVELSNLTKDSVFDASALTVSDLLLLSYFNEMVHFDDEMANRFQRDSADYGDSCYEVCFILKSGQVYTTYASSWNDAIEPVELRDRFLRRSVENTSDDSILLTDAVCSSDGVEYSRVSVLFSDIKTISVRPLAGD